jgi:hypothetical protein
MSRLKLKAPDEPKPVAPTDAEIEYVASFGGRCRDCADEDGICPHSSLPCEPELARKAIRSVITALRYGNFHGYVESPADAQVNRLCKGLYRVSSGSAFFMPRLLDWHNPADVELLLRMDFAERVLAGEDPTVAEQTVNARLAERERLGVPPGDTRKP